jgi:drug/metabolite transporter (DMT)-like permease
LTGNVYRVEPGRLFLSFTRVWLPVLIGIAGIVAIVIGHGTNGTAAAGVGLLIVAVIVWMVNWMYRMSVASNREREREEAARTYFSVHGRWPDE